jgi:hypothetical protein
MSAPRTNELPLQQRAMVAAVFAVREYGGTPAFRALIDLLELHEQHYKEQLVDVTPEGLGRLQGATAQVIGLRKLLEGEPHIDGSI